VDLEITVRICTSGPSLQKKEETNDLNPKLEPHLIMLLLRTINPTESMMKNTPELTEEQIAKRTFLKLKIKHLALEPGLIRFEHERRRKRAAKRGKEYSKWLEVRTHEHKIKKIRPEARAAQLAYAFIRGKSYAQTEAKASPSVAQLTRAAEITLKYGDLPEGTTKHAAYKMLAAWVDVYKVEQAVAVTETAEATT
jgi:hypothetical protein